MLRAVFPGSFDPFTLGHQDIINRALPYFEQIMVAVGTNTDKEYMFTSQQRSNFITRVYFDQSKVVVKTFQGLTVDFCRMVDARVIIRGLRNPADFEFEKAVAQVNRKLSGLDTMFFLTEASKAYISSSMVREIISHEGDYTQFVPKQVRI